MTRADVLTGLQAVFDDFFLIKVQVTPELSAKEVEEWDSLSHISLMVAVEDRFGVRFKTGEAEAVKNVGEFSDLILKKLNAK